MEIIKKEIEPAIRDYGKIYQARDARHYGNGESSGILSHETERNIDAAEFVEEMEGLGTGLSEEAVTHVLEQRSSTTSYHQA